MFDIIKERYKKGYIRQDQLRRYVVLSVLTEKEYESICEQHYQEVDDGDQTAANPI